MDRLKLNEIDMEEIPGYKTLTDENKDIFKVFINEFLNGYGLERRELIVPTNINFCEEFNYVADDPDDSTCIVTVKNIIKAVYSDGKKKIIHRYMNKYGKGLEIIKVYKREYLRFEYKDDNRKIWLHVIAQGKQWY